MHTNANYNTLAHELGHNFGGLHDRNTENLPNSAEYNYGSTWPAHQSLR
ncbi:M12 family metallo-peptidase [Ereboglobus luteus]|uniref:Uncharacterized protein n=1 Tax=Ereboglobus luteus TaxID=1796921 RepID=A0A2U8E224_9BACT|nr:M12 family metallo-peptidase [Ereboglobus luteus]AWI08744.1 hypothetical protein CKA38_05285 [Ereboglobus luteus]